MYVRAHTCMWCLYKWMQIEQCAPTRSHSHNRHLPWERYAYTQCVIVSLATGHFSNGDWVHGTDHCPYWPVVWWGETGLWTPSLCHQSAYTVQRSPGFHSQAVPVDKHEIDTTVRIHAQLSHTAYTCLSFTSACWSSAYVHPCLKLQCSPHLNTSMYCAWPLNSSYVFLRTQYCSYTAQLDLTRQCLSVFHLMATGLCEDISS